MTVRIQFTLTQDELKAIIGDAIAPLIECFCELEISSGTYRHAYSPAEVAEQIGYLKRTIMEFIKQGRKDRRGRAVKLVNIEYYQPIWAIS